MLNSILATFVAIAGTHEGSSALKPAEAEIVHSCASKQANVDQIQACDNALLRVKSPGNRLKILVHRSMAKRRKGDFAGAIADADLAVANIAARDEDSEWWRGAQNERCLVRAFANRELDLAREICSEIIGQVPWDPEPIASDALVSLRRGDWLRAAKEYSLLLLFSPNDRRLQYAEALAQAAYFLTKSQIGRSGASTGMPDAIKPYFDKNMKLLSSTEYEKAKVYFDGLGFDYETVKRSALSGH